MTTVPRQKPADLMLIEAIKTAIDNYAECGMATRSFSGVRHPEICNWSGSIKGSG